MQKIDMHLILTSTNGLFNEKQVPALYVQIQRHRGLLERQLNKQITFSSAVHSWMENYFQPICQIAQGKGLSFAYPEKSLAQRYFLVCAQLEKQQNNNLKEAEMCLINNTTTPIRKFIAKTIA